MNQCSFVNQCHDGHDPIQFEKSDCPLCRERVSRFQSEEKIQQLEGVIDTLRVKLERLELGEQ